MRKFWNLMLAVLVIVGAAACTENNDSVDVKKGGLSFYAEINSDVTRAYIDDADGDKLWKTVWEGNETLTLSDIEYTMSYKFTNTEAEPNKFTCNEEGVEALLGKEVLISGGDQLWDSSKGKNAWAVQSYVDSFDVTSTIQLRTEISFLRYTYAGEGDVTLSLDILMPNGETNTDVFKTTAYDYVTEYRVASVEGETEYWVPFNAGTADDGYDATLSYSIDGEMCNETTIENIKYGKIYNLGELKAAEPVESSYIYLVPSEEWTADNAWFAAHFWDSLGGTEDVTMTDADADGIYECAVPAGMESVIFCRMNPEFSEFGWNTGDEDMKEAPKRVWSQTADLEIGVEPNNYYHIVGWDKGAWGTKTDYELPVVEFSLSVIGFGNDWETDHDMTLDGGYYTLKGVVVAEGDEFKIRESHDWNISYGSTDGSALAVDTETILTSEFGMNLTIATGTYDFYFNYESKAFYPMTVGKTPADATTPDTPATGYALAGDFNGWADLVMESVATNVYVAKGVALSAASGVKVKLPGTWDNCFGAAIEYVEEGKWIAVSTTYDKNIFIAKSGTYDVYFEALGQNSKFYLMAADADYTSATEQTANGELVPDEGGEEVTPGEKSVWALFGDFEGTGNWVDLYMTTTTNANVVVAEDVVLAAAQGFLVRKPSTEWADKYAADNINYLKANHYITTVKDGSDLCVEAAGTYDIYFNTESKVIYLMTADADYATATEQTANGKEPEQEEPEVTENVLYLKPNSNWIKDNARFAAYFFHTGGGDTWVSMSDSDGDGIYEGNIPAGYTFGENVIFCRMNPNTTSNNWNNKWNQTADLVIPTNGDNLYTVKDGSWDKGGGTWSKK